MRTNIDIDDKLMKQTIRASGERTKRAAVETAMRTFVDLKKQERALDRLWGAAKWEGDLEQSRLGRFADQEW
jgi:Arc/MetJ family transcription regulator